MKLKIQTIPMYQIAYIRQTGPYGAENIHAMEQIKNFAKTNALLGEDAILLGIARDNPATAASESCRYDACLVISENFCAKNEHVDFGEISGGKYAIFTIAHTAEAVQEAWCNIFHELQKQGYRLDHTRPIIERYAVKIVQNHACEICVPVY
jgi:DNA gyrase inhibitor GyrI